ncbi:MAG: DUF3313 domain-containing protein [Syntrophorhabdaceae bacterium]|nr:DUF3313 domain-containing protein [Syntrophorhabdaceae bacterium]MDD4197048.1 DUF3313 domain-containing protein [Syntrophorhabdaceae bacterium]
MKKGILGVSITMAMILIFAVSVSIAADKKYSGFLGDSYGFLQPGPEGGVKERYLKPGIDFGKYTAFMVDSVIFFMADDSEYKGIDPLEMKELADAFNAEILKAIEKAGYKVVVEPGPDVARIRIAITKVKSSKPVVSGITSIIPVGIVVSTIKRGATGSWSGSGSTGAEMMVLDSTTNDIIALAVDDRAAGFTERFSKWGSVNDAFKYWGDRLTKFLVAAKQK